MAEKKKTIQNLGLIRKGDKILLAKKKKDSEAGYWNGYGGIIKEGETVEEALIREIREKAGVLALLNQKRGILNIELNDSDEDIEMHIFEVLDFEGEPSESEEMLPKWFHYSEIPYEGMSPNDLHWLAFFLNGKDFRGRFVLGPNYELLEKEILEVENLNEFS